MTLLYRYIGDERTVFISLSVNGHTFAPSKGDTIESIDSISHPLLELVQQAPSSPDDESTLDESPVHITKEPDIKPDTQKSPKDGDAMKEN